MSVVSLYDNSGVISKGSEDIKLTTESIEKLYFAITSRSVDASSRENRSKYPNNPCIHCMYKPESMANILSLTISEYLDSFSRSCLRKRGFPVTLKCLTLTFNRVLEVVEVHVRAKFHQAKCSSS